MADNRAQPADVTQEPVRIQEVLPRSGLVYSEKSSMVEIVCKPKMLPIKSHALLRLEELERAANEAKRVPGAPGTSYGRSGQ